MLFFRKTTYILSKTSLLFRETHLPSLSLRLPRKEKGRLRRETYPLSLSFTLRRIGIEDMRQETGFFFAEIHVQRRKRGVRNGETYVPRVSFILPRNNWWLPRKKIVFFHQKINPIFQKWGKQRLLIVRNRNCIWLQRWLGGFAGCIYRDLRVCSASILRGTWMTDWRRWRRREPSPVIRHGRMHPLRIMCIWRMPLRTVVSVFRY